MHSYFFCAVYAAKTGITPTEYNIRGKSYLPIIIALLFSSEVSLIHLSILILNAFCFMNSEVVYNFVMHALA